MSWNLPIFSLRKNVSGIHTFVESVIVRYLILSERRGRKIDNSVSELRMFKTSNIAPILKKTYIWEIFPSNLRVSINLSLFVSILPPNPISNKIEMQMTATTTTTTTSPSPSWKYDGRMGKRRRLRRVVDAVRASPSLSLSLLGGTHKIGPLPPPPQSTLVTRARSLRRLTQHESQSPKGGHPRPRRNALRIVGCQHYSEIMKRHTDDKTY